MKRSLFAGALLAVSVLALHAGPAAADDCAALGGVFDSALNECQLSQTAVRAGAFTVGTPGAPVTLRILATGRIVVPEVATVQNSLTLTIHGGLVIENGGAIVGDAAAATGIAAKLAVSASGDIVLRTGLTGAAITANGPATVCGAGGSAGSVTLLSTRGNVTLEPASEVTANSRCPAGDISVRAEIGHVTVGGFVESITGGAGTRGGPVTVVAGGSLTIQRTGQVRSAGVDAGANLVHLESGGDTVITGLTESTGGARFIGANLCATAERPQATGCVEVWSGGKVTVDSVTGLGFVRARSGAVAGAGTVGVCCPWIDIFANGDITVIGQSPASGLLFSVDADQVATNGFAGHITVKSLRGKVTASGRAFTGKAISANGGVGGKIVIQAGGPVDYPPGVDHPADPGSNIDLNDAIVLAVGDADPTLANTGGLIAIRSFNGEVTGGGRVDPVTGTRVATGDIFDGFLQAGGSGTVRLDTQFCGGLKYVGVIEPATALPLPVECGGRPTVPEAVQAALLPRPTVSLADGRFPAGAFDKPGYEATARVLGVDGLPIPGATLDFSYQDADGNPVATPTAVGVYIVTASFAGNAQYKRASTVAKLILHEPGAVTAPRFTFSGAVQTYTGTPQGVGVATDPVVSPVDCTYDGSPAQPIAAGTYAVACTFPGSVSFAPATGTTTFTIEKATPTVTAVGGTVVYDGNPHGAGTATGVQGEALAPVALTVTAADGTTGAVPPRDTGTYTLVARFAGGANYVAAESAPATLTITPAPAVLTLAPQRLPFTGTAQAAVATATGVRGENLASFVTFEYRTAGGVAVAAPVEPGVYTVFATLEHPNHQAVTATSTLEIFRRQAPRIVLAGTGVFDFDGGAHLVTGNALGVNGEVLAPPLLITYTDAAGAPVAAPILPGRYTVTASFAGNADFDPATVTDILSIVVRGAAENCILVDFREVTLFRDRMVLTSSDPTIRANHGLAGGFDAHAWPFAPGGGKERTTSRGTEHRIYGFAASQRGVLVPNADTGAAYAVTEDPEIPGAFYIDLGGPARVIVCPSQLQTNLLERGAQPTEGNLPGTGTLRDDQKNVPGIMLTHNTDRLGIPSPIRDELRALGTPLVDDRGQEASHGIVHYIGVQQWGAGQGPFREFVDVEIQFLADNPADRVAHFKVGFHTVAHGSFQGFLNCDYLDHGPGNDGVRFHNRWDSSGGHDVGFACGDGERRENQLLRADYDLGLNAAQLLSTVEGGDDTLRIFFGEIRPENDHDDGGN